MKFLYLILWPVLSVISSVSADFSFDESLNYYRMLPISGSVAALNDSVPVQARGAEALTDGTEYTVTEGFEDGTFLYPGSGEWVEWSRDKVIETMDIRWEDASGCHVLFIRFNSIAKLAIKKFYTGKTGKKATISIIIDPYRDACELVMSELGKESTFRIPKISYHTKWHCHPTQRKQI